VTAAFPAVTLENVALDVLHEPALVSAELTLLFDGADARLLLEIDLDGLRRHGTSCVA
jgi:hypothetical protein